MNLNWLILSIFLCISTTQAQKPLRVDLSEDLFMPQQYLVQKCTDSLTIDGKANELAWQNTAFTNSFVDIEGVKTPKYDCRVKMLWDERYLYIYALLEEPHIWANLTQHDAVIFYNNDFEVFIDPIDDTYDYTELEINALNTTWDLKLNKPYRFGGRANNHYEIEGLQTAVHIEGTLNDPSDLDSCWSTEIAIPLEVVMRAKRGLPKAPKVGDYWRINFSRVQWEHELIEGEYQRKKVAGKLLPEYNWVWSKQNAINMHIPERWGIIEFSDKTAGKPATFQQELEGFWSKQVAYGLLRNIKFGPNKQLLQLKAGKTQKIAPFLVQKQRFEATFIKTYFGFEIKVTNRTNKETYIINETGSCRKLH